VLLVLAVVELVLELLSLLLVEVLLALLSLLASDLLELSLWLDSLLPLAPLLLLAPDLRA